MAKGAAVVRAVGEGTNAQTTGSEEKMDVDAPVMAKALAVAVPASLSGVTACAVTPGCRSSGLNRVRVRDGHTVRVRATASAGLGLGLGFGLYIPCLRPPPRESNHERRAARLGESSSSPLGRLGLAWCSTCSSPCQG